jgi:serpin B
MSDMAIRGTRLLVLAALLGVLTSACGTAAAAEEVRSTSPRAAADVAAAKKTNAALDAFAVDLYHRLATGSGNVVLSPYSVAVALAMTRAGAAGETARQMDAVLRSSLAGDLDAAHNALDQAIAKRPGKYKVGDETRELEVATANRLWGQKGTRFEQAFLDRLAASYGAGMQIVDYKTAADASRKTINDWVAARTKDRIKDLIPQGVLDASTRLVLTNAIYLKASWMVRFDDAVAAPFSRLNGSLISAQLMHQSETMRYGEGIGYQIVAIPYAGGLSMLVIVPNSGRFASVEAALDGATLRAAIDGMRPRHVNLSFPKFTFRTEASLKDALAAMGMPIAFTDTADFSGMTKQEPLAIAEVLHQAFIAVDEKGTEAAAATAVVMRTTSAPLSPVELRVDRPFMFAIQDDETGALLFMGRVTDPKAN